jgi:hypothetical protein
MIEKLYGVFIHTWQGKIALGLFPKESALGLVKILDSRFGMDGDDMTGAFGPLDVTKPYLILEGNPFNITTGSFYDAGEFTDVYKIGSFKKNVGKFQDVASGKFKEPDDLFNTWYKDDENLKPVEIKFIS